ncbi:MULTISPECIES: Cd(II)/Pb(II)-responsive transcriptional regulator [Sphaerotilaceae]|uniref:Cd(II)/Pb(II)-responsive transcriptional regulator n=2 Tax=Sphaerotilaceae TaxID=2975441 RepID=A0ABW7FYW0_9BURK|nr:Cd(II)/Pb(II)-responsive transcriptional regulator [Ideonella paludis]MBQ0936304.1 Cd(II)/Pb(II)-responsive transcriptional regulator [Ideonella paludis]
MRIGNLAEATGTPVETIRFYEREGLIPAAQRSENNYRVYTVAHAERLAFIRQCRNLDMALDEIRALLRLRDAAPEDCGEVNKILDAHIEHVAKRIRELRSLESTLKALRARCQSPHAMEACGILNHLDNAASQGTRTAGHLHIRGAH